MCWCVSFIKYHILDNMKTVLVDANEVSSPLLLLRWVEGENYIYAANESTVSECVLSVPDFFLQVVSHVIISIHFEACSRQSLLIIYTLVSS